MATIEDEKGYEIAVRYLTKKYGEDYVDFLETEGQSYLDGYEQGYEDCRHYAHDYYKPKWHVLQKDPNDLPKEGGIYLILQEDNAGFSHYCVRDFRNGHFECTNRIIEWCELPKA